MSDASASTATIEVPVLVLQLPSSMSSICYLCPKCRLCPKSLRGRRPGSSVFIGLVFVSHFIKMLVN